MLKNPRYKMAFAKLGESWDLNEETFNVLQEFVTELYGIGRAAGVNAARYKIFSRKFANEEKTVDMSALPPCESVLRLHCQRANYLAGIWKRSVISQSSIPSSVYHGWNPDKSLTWCTEIFPEEVESILMDTRYDPDDGNDAQCESDEEEDTS